MLRSDKDIANCYNCEHYRVVDDWAYYSCQKPQKQGACSLLQKEVMDDGLCEQFVQGEIPF